MDQKHKRALVVAGAKVGARLFRRAMDHFAAKRPNGLVARFRNRFGIVSEDAVADALKKGGKAVADKVRK